MTNNFKKSQVLKKNINNNLRDIILNRILNEFTPLEISRILEEDYKNIHSQFTRGKNTMKLKTLLNYAEGLGIELIVATN